MSRKNDHGQLTIGHIINGGTNRPHRLCVQQGAEKCRPLDGRHDDCGRKTHKTNELHDDSPLAKVVAHKSRVIVRVRGARGIRRAEKPLSDVEGIVQASPA
jgi:hypothetical protein